MCFSTIEEAAEDIRQGKMVIIVDDEDRENEGDLTCAACKVTPDIINFMAKYGRGLICLAMEKKSLKKLKIEPMVERNTAPYGTAFCVSIDAKHNVTTGISAADRAQTILTAINPKSKPSDLSRPGHIFPLMARKGGVLRRAGQTEASVDLARIAGFYPAGVICEIMNEDGTMARVPQLKVFTEKFGLKMITVADLITYRLQHEKFVRKVAQTNIPTPVGKFKLIAYENKLDKKFHVALVMGKIQSKDKVLVRVHSQCLTGDVFHSLRCDCGEQLHMSMKLIASEGKGVILYLNQEGRGIGLLNKIKAYELQDKGDDTVEANEHLGFKADPRDYGIGAQILSDLGLRRIRVMTNNPKKFVALKGYGLKIVERVPLEVSPNEVNRKYLKTKREKMGHYLTIN